MCGCLHTLFMEAASFGPTPLAPLQIEENLCESHDIAGHFSNGL